MVKRELDPDKFIAEYISPKIKLSAQCYFIEKIKKKDIRLVPHKKSKEFNSLRYETEAFYKPIHLPFDVTKCTL